MAQVAPPRLPLRPLENYLRTHCEQVLREPDQASGGIELEEGRIPPYILARLFNVSRQSAHRWNLYGVPYYTADQLCAQLNVHPLLIWPQYHPFDIDNEEEDSLCLT